ncbi:MAG: hypothetical protein K9L56_15255 [Clostridiales bacterium]|nr:hypothetical protein [Clostridiales bacterium]
MYKITIPNDIHFNENKVEELIHVEKLSSDDIQKFNDNLFKAIDGNSILDYNEPVVALVKGFYYLEDDEVGYVSNEKLVNDGLIDFIPKKVIDNDDCMTPKDLDRFIEDTEYESVGDFIKVYLKGDGIDE